MKIAVLGAGLMGPTIAMDCIESDEVEEVLLLDIDKVRLNEAVDKLGNPSKLKTKVQDVTDRKSLVKSLKGYDVVGVALLRWLNVDSIWGAIEAGVHAVDLSGPPEKDWGEIDSAAKNADVSVIPGCGVEPGLTDLLATYGMDMLDVVEAVDIWCGGIPQEPKPPLNYKIVFGGPYLPLRPGNVKIIEEGEERKVKRYTLGDPVQFEGIDRELECFYDGFPETLHEVERFKGVKRCTEKTVRYEGYCEKVNFLEGCGLLNREPINFKGQNIMPFEFFSKVVYPKVKLEKGEKDITVLRVEVQGVKNDIDTCIKFDMVDHYDEKKGITSMAKTTSYTAAIAARMLGRGDIAMRGLVPPVKVIRGNLFKQMLTELSVRDVNIRKYQTSTQKIA